MCGIAGIINLSDRFAANELADLARRMSNAMDYRGPDDWGVWVDPEGHCALSHRRLSVIDLSAAGHQPMPSADGRTVLSFNGEIYNYRRLRKGLEARGVRFDSQSDTEVLLAGLTVDGPDFLSEIDGMYAFGLWNARERSLLLGRDNFGEKPLYYTQTADYFAFASELHALAMLPGFDAGIDRWRISHYLSFQYVPAPLTIYRGAKKLLPGHWLKFDRNGATECGRHFQFRTSSQAVRHRSLDDLADELEEILVDGLRDRLISDVPLGAMLSGGVDSSTVVALIRRRLGVPLKTFSMGFAGTPDSEHFAAAEMARHLGTEHYDEIVSPDIVALGRRMGDLMDEPNADSSCLPTLLLSQLVRKHVTVSLSGDGGDEMFGGYGRYLEVLSDAAEKAGGKPTMGAWRPGKAYYSARILVFPDHELDPLMGGIPETTATLLAKLRGGITDDPRPLGNVLRESDADNYLPGAVLAKVDRMSMQASLEVRAPLLGRAVADFAAGLAEADCFEPGRGKRVLKQLAARYIPAEWINRPKMGFGMPVRDWGVRELIGPARADLLSPGGRVAEWLDRGAIEAFFDRQAVKPNLYQLWSLFLLEHWLRRHPATPV